PDAEVRRVAIGATTLLIRSGAFQKELLEILWHGPEDERLLVCPGLGHWNGRQALAVFSSRSQPAAVRVAAFRSVQLWRSQEFGRGLGQTLIPMFDDPDPQLRLLAVEASRWIETGEAVRVWLAATRSGDPEVARQAVAVWID